MGKEYEKYILGDNQHYQGFISYKGPSLSLCIMGSREMAPLLARHANGILTSKSGWDKIIW